MTKMLCSRARSSSDVGIRNPSISIRNGMKINTSPPSDTQKPIITETPATPLPSNSVNHSNTFPRKGKSPKMQRKSTMETSQPSHLTVHVESSRQSSPTHKSDLSPNKSPSCQSLPDLLDGAKVNGKGEAGAKSFVKPSPFVERKQKRGLSSIFKIKKKL